VNRTRADRPYWYRLAWFLGTPPELSRRQWRVLGLVSAVSFFEMYDVYLFALNLKQIQAELGIAEGDLGFLGSLVRAGSLLSFLPAMAADRVGRRRMLLVTVLGYTLLTGATAFSPNAETFVVLQFLARAFASAETVLATVVIVEEFAPEHRGWGIGAAGAVQACGAGAAALLFGFVEVMPYGWRTLYALALAPLLLIVHWRRTLPETRRYRELVDAQACVAQQGVEVVPRIGGVIALASRYPGRLLGLAAASFVLSTATTALGFFTPKYLQDEHQWSPSGIAVMTFLAGMFAILGNPLAGKLSDRIGRRPVAVACATTVAVVGFAFYSASGALLPVLWALLVFVEFGIAVTLAAFAAELFPTAHRATAGATRVMSGTLGAVAGLAAVSLLYDVLGNNWDAVRVLALCCLGVSVIVWTTFPETAGRRLEDIAPDGERSSRI